MADHSEQSQLTNLVLLVPSGACLLGATTSTTTQQLLIQGSYAGSIDLAAQSHLVIAESADVQAERLAAHTVIIYGRFDGHIHAHVVELGEKARVSGSVCYTGALGCKPGARIRANIEGPEDDA